MSGTAGGGGSRVSRFAFRPRFGKQALCKSGMKASGKGGHQGLKEHHRGGWLEVWHHEVHSSVEQLPCDSALSMLTESGAGCYRRAVTVSLEAGCQFDSGPSGRTPVQIREAVPSCRACCQVCPSLCQFSFPPSPSPPFPPLPVIRGELSRRSKTANGNTSALCVAPAVQ